MSPCCFRKSARGAHMSTFCSAAQVVVVLHVVVVLVVVAVLLARTLCAVDNFSEKFLPAETRNGSRRGGGRVEGVRRRTWRAAQLEIGNFWMSLLSKSYNLNVICNCKKGDSRTEPKTGGRAGMRVEPVQRCHRVCVWRATGERQLVCSNAVKSMRRRQVVKCLMCLGSGKTKAFNQLLIPPAQPPLPPNPGLSAALTHSPLSSAGG